MRLTVPDHLHSIEYYRQHARDRREHVYTEVVDDQGFVLVHDPERREQWLARYARTCAEDYLGRVRARPGDWLVHVYRSSTASGTTSSASACAGATGNVGRMADGDAGAEPEVVCVARDILAGRRHPDELDAAFAAATVYGQRPDAPGVMVASLPGQGQWTLVFSTIERLAAYAGDCAYFATTGADLLAQLPPGVGALLDAGDCHRISVVTNLLPAAQLDAMRESLTRSHSDGDGRSDA